MSIERQVAQGQVRLFLFFPLRPRAARLGTAQSASGVPPARLGVPALTTNDSFSGQLTGSGQVLMSAREFAVPDTKRKIPDPRDTRA
jgi:hypothetical protein